MDALSGLLDGSRARGAFLLRTVMDPPWSVRVEDEAPLSVVAVVRGESWAIPEAGQARRLGAGDLAIMRGPDPYTFADHPTTPPQAVILPSGRCSTPDGGDLAEAMDLGVRTWGNDPNGSAMLLVGTYQMRTEISHRLLRALPALLVLERDSWDDPLVALLNDEVVKNDPGQAVVLDRLLDLLLISALRTWFTRSDAAPPWFRAHNDRVVGRALRLIHNNPAHQWTVGSLAAAVGVSRAAFARRFAELVGEPPMAYLTSWRLALAADLLREPDATVGAVARQVGYGSPFALSAAFKRMHGVSPQQHRAALAV